MDYYRTEIKIFVLSEEVYDSRNLKDVYYDIIEGDCSGVVKFSPSEKVDGETMKKLLIEQGSAPDFFWSLSDDFEQD